MAKTVFKPKLLRISTALLLMALLFNIPLYLVSAAVAPQWTPTNTGVVVANAVGDISSNPVWQDEQQIVRTSAGNYIIAWADHRNETDIDLYAQMLDENGNEQWTSNGIAVSATTGDQPIDDLNADQPDLALVADQSGGAIIAWADSRSGSEIYVQRISSSGTAEWTANGVKITNSEDGSEPYLLSDGSDGAYVAWTDETGATKDVGFTHILDDGSIDPTPGTDWNPPTVTGSGTNDEYDVHITQLDSNNILFSYELYKPGDVQYEIEAFKVTSGVAGSTFTLAADGTDDMRNHEIIADGTGGAIYAFEYQALHDDIRVNRIDNANKLDWEGTGTGVVICDETERQYNPHLVADNIGSPTGAIITWTDNRLAGDLDIYAQRVNGSGTEQWASDGIPISDNGDGQSQYDNWITSNGGYGALLAYWSEEATFSDIVAQHINSDGTAQWTSGGVVVETDQTAFYDDYQPHIVSDGAGGGVVAWARRPATTTSDIHAQYIDDPDPYTGGVCVEAGSSEFCGQQHISSYVLSFIDIPDTFSFPTVTTGTTQNVCNNTSTLGTPADTCSDSTTPDPPGADDLLTVRDERDDGGFVVQVTTQGTFTDGSNTIPLDNLYMITTIDEGAANKSNGIVYSSPTIIYGSDNAPLYVDESTEDISDPDTYTSSSNWSYQSSPYDTLLVTQFGGGILDLIDATLTSPAGRVGDMSLYANFNLIVDFDQAPGDFSLVLTYDLTDSTL